MCAHKRSVRTTGTTANKQPDRSDGSAVGGQYALLHDYHGTYCGISVPFTPKPPFWGGAILKLRGSNSSFLVFLARALSSCNSALIWVVQTG